MGSRTGLDAQLGYALETTWATPVVPDHFIGFDSETHEGHKSTVQDNGIRAGQRFQRALGRVIATRDAGGGFTASLHNAGGFGLLFSAALGASTNTLRAGQTAVWDQVHTPSKPKSLTIQKGVPEASTDTVQPYTYNGCKIASLDIQISAGGIVKVVVTVIAQAERTLATTPAGLALATPVYSTTSVPLAFGGAALSLGGTPIAAVKSMNVKLNNPFTSVQDDTYIGGGGFRSEPKTNALATIDGSMSADFTTRAALYDAFQTDASLAMVVTLAGPTVGTGAGVPSGLVINIPVVKLNGEAPKVGGTGTVPITCPYEGFSDDVTTPITYTYTTTDATY